MSFDAIWVCLKCGWVCHDFVTEICKDCNWARHRKLKR